MALCGGCAAPGPRGKLPYGHWSGCGVFVYERWNEDDNPEAGKQQSIRRHYPTTLAIQPGKLDGQDVILLEICSDRGPLPDLGDRTHLKLAVTEAKRVSPDTVLYRVVDVLFNPKSGQKLSLDETAPPFGAICSSVNGTTTFQIVYMDNFVDTFRFRGRHVEKTGMYYSKDGGLIWWSERLTRHR